MAPPLFELIALDKRTIDPRTIWAPDAIALSHGAISRIQQRDVSVQLLESLKTTSAYGYIQIQIPLLK